MTPEEIKKRAKRQRIRKVLRSLQEKEKKSNATKEEEDLRWYRIEKYDRIIKEKHDELFALNKKINKTISEIEKLKKAKEELQNCGKVQQTIDFNQKNNYNVRSSSGNTKQDSKYTEDGIRINKSDDETSPESDRREGEQSYSRSYKNCKSSISRSNDERGRRDCKKNMGSSSSDSGKESDQRICKENSGHQSFSDNAAYSGQSRPSSEDVSKRTSIFDLTEEQKQTKDNQDVSHLST
jgi:hypothetical protein